MLIAEDLADPGRLAELANGADELARARRAVHARGRGAGMRDRRRRDPAPGARARRRRARRRVRPHRHHDAALRHARELARRHAQLPHRQPRPRGRGDVPARRGRPAQLRRPRPGRQGRADRPLVEPGVRACPRRSASCRSPGSPRRSPPPATGRCARWSRSPATLCVSTPDSAALEAAVDDARLHRLGRHLRQRDDPPRRRHPPRPRAAARRPTTTPRSTSSPSAAWPTGRQPCSRSRTVSRRSGRSCSRLAAIAAGQGPDADIEAWDDLVVQTLVESRARV